MYKREKTVTCLQVTKWIPEFIENKMKVDELELFLKHIQSCSNCKEELSIQYLVSVGLDSLENSNNFNLQSELENALEMAYKKIRMHHFLLQALYSLIAIAAFGLIVTIALLMIL